MTTMMLSQSSIISVDATIQRSLAAPSLSSLYKQYFLLTYVPLFVCKCCSLLLKGKLSLIQTYLLPVKIIYRQQVNQFSTFCVLNIRGKKYLLLSKSNQVYTTVYSPKPHPVKPNNLPQSKAKMRPRQAGRPGPGLSPPTHCQLDCYSKARKQVTQASHVLHTPTYQHKHTP